jgi:ribosomal protein S12 methylthiotransferase accessory factor
MNRLHTSMRTAAPEHTLKLARAWAERAGIRSVTEITQLDCLGVPIFVSERGAALSDGFTFGKGLAAIESEIGAHMEAIECHFAEPGASAVETRWGTPRDLPASCGHDPILEFAPLVNRRAAPDQRLLLARARDVETGACAWVPAELVFYPAPDTGAELFGASTNGLASGNSLMEASLHALLELIERDIWSIDFVRDASRLVAPSSLPPQAREIVARAERNGLSLVVRAVPNDFAMPFFAAFLFDPERPQRRFFNGGWGCHLDPTIALMRAVTEVAQSRAAFLHGGREAPEWDGSGREADGVRAEMERVSRDTGSVSFVDIAEPGTASSLDAQWARAVACLRRVVRAPVYRVVYTPDEGPLHVVRLIVPLLEHFTKETMRVGPRLQAALEAGAEAAA